MFGLPMKWSQSRANVVSVTESCNVLHNNTYPIPNTNTQNPKPKTDPKAGHFHFFSWANKFHVVHAEWIPRPTKIRQIKISFKVCFRFGFVIDCNFSGTLSYLRSVSATHIHLIDRSLLHILHIWRMCGLCVCLFVKFYFILWSCFFFCFLSDIHTLVLSIRFFSCNKNPCWCGACLNFYLLSMMLFSLFFAISFDFVSFYSTKSQIFFFSFSIFAPSIVRSRSTSSAYCAMNECSSISVLVVIIIYSCGVPFAGKRSCNYFPIRITRAIEQNKRSIRWIEK